MRRRRRGPALRRAGLAVALALIAALPALVGAAPTSAPAPSGAATPPARGGPGSGGPAPGVAARVLEGLAAHHVPASVAYLPNLAGRETVREGVVGPLFTEGPAPVGIASLGVENRTGTPRASVLDTASVEGTIALSNLSVDYLDNDAPDFLGTQLNAVLTNVTLFNGSGNVFWAQDVFRYSDRTHQLEFIDNVWNFSNPSFTLSANAFNATAPGGTVVGTEFYYDVGPVLNLSLPFTVQLYLNTSLAQVGGLPLDQLWFNYSVTAPTGPVRNGSFDRVLFNSQAPGRPNASLASPVFQVNGGNVTPTGYLPYDAEMVLGGPGDGSTTSVYAINATLGLDYLGTGGRYLSVPSALDFGSDTGETVEGVAAWYNSTHAVHLGPGPTIFEYLWNASATAAPGHLTIDGRVTPAPAFAFLCRTHVLNVASAAWAPVALNGSFSYALPSGPYELELLLAGYDPAFAAILGTVPSSWNVSVNLTKDPHVGLSTPIVARSDAQLAALVVGGNGSAGAPYLLPNWSASNLSGLFGAMNEFGYPVFPGVLLEGIGAHVDLEGLPALTVPYVGAALNFTGALGLPSSNDLQVEFEDSTNLTLWGSDQLTGWFSPYLGGLVEASFVAWNSSDLLLGDDSFASEGASALLYGGTDNVVWGSRFTTGTIGGADYDAAAPVGLEVYESGDLVYDNLFNVTVPAASPSDTFYTTTFTASTAARYTDRWNVSAAPANATLAVDGFALSGSIVGGTTEGGNAWANYGNASNPLDRLPYDDGGAIAVGGDYLPLYGPAQGGEVPGVISFAATGLPEGTDWNVTLDGAPYASGGTAYVNVSVVAGRFPFSIGAPAGYNASPAGGLATIDGPSLRIPVDFSGPPPRPSLWPVDFLVEGCGGTVDVTLNGTEGSGEGSVAFEEVNGTYPYAVAAVPGYVGPSGGNVTVAGPTNVTLNFARATGWIAGTVAPIAATLEIAGAAVATSYGAFNVSEPTGLVEVAAEAPSYLPFWTNVTVAEGTTTVLTISLTPSTTSVSEPPAVVTFEETGLAAGTPWAVRLSNGSRLAGSTATLSEELAAGPWTFSVPAERNYVLLAPPGGSGSFELEGRNLSVPIAFAPDNGTIVVTVTPAAAALFVDGRAVPDPGGSANVSVAAGNHSVELAARGFATWLETVDVPPNASVPLDVALSPLAAPPAVAPPAAPASPGPGRYALPLLGGGVIVLAVALLLVLRARRRPPVAPAPP